MLLDFSILVTTDDSRIGLLLDSKLVVVVNKTFSPLDLDVEDEATIISLPGLALVIVADTPKACSLLDAVVEDVIDDKAVTLLLDIFPVDTNNAVEISSVLATAFDDEEINLLLDSVLTDVENGMIGLLLDAVLVGVINAVGVCSLLNMVLLEATNDVDATEFAVVSDVIGVVEVPELYKSCTELTDVLIDVAVVCTS